jgi:hypothetical protein
MVSVTKLYKSFKKTVYGVDQFFSTKAIDESSQEIQNLQVKSLLEVLGSFL